MPNTPQDVPEAPKPWQASLEAIGKRALDRQAQPDHSSRPRVLADREGDPAPVTTTAAEAAAQEVEEARQAGQLGYMARVTVQASLPVSDPHSQVYVRRNAHKMVLRVTSLKGEGLPYGSLARLLLTWATTEAVRTRSPELRLGHSLQEFLNKLELGRSGGAKGDITRLRRQTSRLFSCAISADYSDISQDSFTAVLIARQHNLWWDPGNPEQLALWGSTVTLSGDFYQQLVAAPVPVDLAVIRQLRSSALALDIYAWATWRMSFLSRETAIPWEYLQDQFGSNYHRLRDFRRRFSQALATVLKHYEAGIEPRSSGLLLRPSPPSVARRR
ncbi:MAG: replication protein RepA [Candidatus Dormibacteraeota bacterium]|nr:replication protein RepA [Candidatus Dormibacteraeota bacterium]